jgi:hypothetical protein
VTDIGVLVSACATDEVLCQPTRLIEDGVDLPLVILSIGTVTIRMPRSVAAEVERKIATALERFK